MADLDTPAVNRKREFSDTSCSIKSEEAVCAEESRASKRNKTHDSLDRGSNSQTANVVSTVVILLLHSDHSQVMSRIHSA